MLMMMMIEHALIDRYRQREWNIYVLQIYTLRDTLCHIDNYYIYNSSLYGVGGVGDSLTYDTV